MTNEFYARDTSRKIRAVLWAKGERGGYTCSHPPYGYINDPENKAKWIVDEEAAAVVRRIYKMCMEGRGPLQIAHQLTEDNILIPTAYNLAHGRKIAHAAPAEPYIWHAATVARILGQRMYTGCAVNFQTYSNSIWDKKTRFTPEDKVLVFPNTHPAIISGEEFDRVQKIREHRQRRTKNGKSHMLSGMVFCGECGARMYFMSSKKGADYFKCGKSEADGIKRCTAHYIRAVVLKELVWSHMKIVISYVLYHEQHFRRIMEKELHAQTAQIVRKNRKELAKQENRVKELDFLIMKLYESNAYGKLSDERFATMLESYEVEQKALKESIAELEVKVAAQEQQHEDIERFIQKVQQYANLTELTPYALRDLVQVIYVHETVPEDGGKREKSIEIRYDFPAFIPIEKLVE